MRLWLTALLVLPLISDLALPSPPQEVKEWLRHHAVSFDLEDEDTFSFLDPLLGETPVVSIGEEVHGVHEFLEAKRRLALYLVRKYGFRGIALEDGTIKAYALDEYLRTGQGEPGNLLNRYYWCWNTREIKDLFAALREENEKRKPTDQLQFFGVDCQSPHSALSLLAKENSDTPEAVTLIEELGQALSVGRRAYLERTENEKAEARTKLERLRELLGGSRPLRVLFQVQELWSVSDALDRMNLRDRFMAENLMVTQQGDRIRTVFLAHNAHIGRGQFYGRVTPVGAHLDQRLPARPLVVGLFFGRGTILADPRGRRLEDAIRSSDPEELSGALGSVDHSAYSVVLRGAKMSDVVRAWFEQPPPGHFRNSAPPPSLSGGYDALIFFREVAPAASRNPALYRQATLAQALHEQRWDEALAIIETTLTSNPDDLKSLRARFDIWAVQKKNQDQALTYGKVLGQRLAEDARELNNLAWALLTEARYEMLYTQLALELANRCNELTSHENWGYLDTLALANFHAGHIEEAIALEQKAIERCEGPQKKGLKETLERFRQARE